MSYTEDDYNLSHRKITTRVIGSILSVILTVIPFIMVTNRLTEKTSTIIIIFLTAIIQILVHFACFLHVNVKSNEGWNLAALIFTIIIISILMIGSIWIMWNLNYNMMIH